MKEPNLPTKIVSLGKAIMSETKAIAQGEEPVSAEEQHRRLTICMGCEYYDSGKCLLCGCNMTVKTKFRTAHCPFTPPKW
jgi:uncharacterized Fe-S cluster-containing MiaB family protein